MVWVRRAAAQDPEERQHDVQAACQPGGSFTPIRVLYRPSRNPNLALLTLCSLFASHTYSHHQRAPRQSRRGASDNQHMSLASSMLRLYHLTTTVV